jgi:hypothetical protein
MARREQTRTKEPPTPTLPRGRSRHADASATKTVETTGTDTSHDNVRELFPGSHLFSALREDVWEPIPGTRFFSRSGSGIYERLTDQLFLRVDEVDDPDAAEVVKRFAEAFAGSTKTKAARIDASAEKEATVILARIDRELAVEEALTQQLLQRYGLAS